MTTAGPVTKLQRSFAYRLSRWFPAEMLRWMDVISGIVDNIAPSPGSQANTRYVTLGGNDTTGDGSFENPFLTIARAMTSITLATTTNPWLVDVGPGRFATSFTIKNGVTIRGAGSGSGNFNGAPTIAATCIAPNTVQVLDASFAGAGEKSSSIINCAFLNDFQADFAAIGLTGNAAFLIDDVLTQNDVIFNGYAAGQAYVSVKDLYINAVADLRFINMQGSAITSFMSDFGGSLVYTQSAAFQSFHEITAAFVGNVTCTWTSALLTNFMSILQTSPVSPNGSVFLGVGITLVGAGLIFTSQQGLTLAMPDAAANIGFGATAAPDMIGCSTGFNLINATPTATRVLTFNRPVGNSRPTTFRVRNLTITANININFTFAGGAVLAPGNPTYCPPGSEVELTYDFINGRWDVMPYVQSGTTTLVNGVSPVITADIAAASRIVATLKNVSGVFGTIAANVRTNGTKVGGGSFQLTSILPATGATVATDQGDYDWHIRQS